MLRFITAAAIAVALSSSPALAQSKPPADDEACSAMLGQLSEAISNRELPEDQIDRVLKLYEATENHCNENRFAEAHRTATELKRLLSAR